MCLQLYCFIRCKLGTQAVKAPGESHSAVRCIPRVPLEAGDACRVGFQKGCGFQFDSEQGGKGVGVQGRLQEEKSLDFIVFLVCRAKTKARKSRPGHPALWKHADLCQDTQACQAQHHLCLF